MVPDRISRLDSIFSDFEGDYIMRKNLLAAALALTIFMSPAAVYGEEAVTYDGNLREENGTLLPMLSYSDPRDPEYSNEDSDILRYCVYVETDNDTDNDGLADLVKVFVQVPRSAAEGKYGRKNRLTMTACTGSAKSARPRGK